LYAISGHGDQFILKGATLFTVWQGEPHRATRDVDLLGHGAPTIERLVEIFRAIAAADTEEADGLVIDPATVVGARIREDQEYEGVRITLVATLTNARIRLQVDVGFGDVVLPAPEEVEIPAILGFQPARLRAYPKEAVVAEKLQAMVALGEGNSRLKDFYDLWTLARGHHFDGPRLAEAIVGTFARRRTPLPDSMPVALTPMFTENPVKLTQWRGFLARAGVAEEPPALADVAGVLAGFLLPPVAAATASEPFVGRWSPGGPWER
jgi:predicted nucleotidyltransferase component of viral defense system